MIALITASAKGIGAKIAYHLAKKGYEVVLLYHTSHVETSAICDQIHSLNGKAHKMKVDFSTKEGVISFCNEYKALYEKTTLLINNWGSYCVGPLSSLDVDLFLDTFQSNLFVPFILTKELIPLLRKTKGSVINIGVTGLNTLKANTYFPAYSIAKLSLLQMTRSFAKELAQEEITVNMISPGYLENSVDKPSLEKLPLKRVAKYEEVLDVLDFLIQNRYVTGQNIEISGGVGL